MRAGGRFSVITFRPASAVLTTALGLFIASGHDAAFAQTADMANLCTGRSRARVDDRIRACSSLIDAQKGDNDKLAILYTSRGAAWRQKGDLDHALADHDQAVRLQPGSALLYFNRAVTWRAKNDPDRAIADFTVAIRLAPRFVLAYRNRGDLLYGKGGYADAIRDYDSATRLNAKDARARAMRGLAKWQLGDGNGGKADIAAAMRLDVVTTVALVAQARPTGDAAPMPPPAGAPSIWDFKGSHVSLKADGADRRFYYEAPRPELVISGITPGTLLFEGRKDGNQYAGKAFVFSRKCGARSYAVSGLVDTTPPTVTIRLSGKRPAIDANCRPTGTFRNDMLIFSYPAR